MIIKDLTCNNCGCDYDIDDMGTSVIIHYKNIESDVIRCPACGSYLYSERHFDDSWDEE